MANWFYRADSTYRKGLGAWAALTPYVQGDKRRPTNGNSAGGTKYWLECTTAGTSGAAEPTWGAATYGATVNDGTVVWTKRGTGDADTTADQAWNIEDVEINAKGGSDDYQLFCIDTGDYVLTQTTGVIFNVAATLNSRSDVFGINQGQTNFSSTPIVVDATSVTSGAAVIVKGDYYRFGPLQIKNSGAEGIQVGSSTGQARYCYFHRLDVRDCVGAGMTASSATTSGNNFFYFPQFLNNGGYNAVTVGSAGGNVFFHPLFSSAGGTREYWTDQTDFVINGEFLPDTATYAAYGTAYLVGCSVTRISALNDANNYYAFYNPRVAVDCLFNNLANAGAGIGYDLRYSRTWSGGHVAYSTDGPANVITSVGALGTPLGYSEISTASATTDRYTSASALFSSNNLTPAIDLSAYALRYGQDVNVSEPDWRVPGAVQVGASGGGGGGGHSWVVGSNGVVRDP